uniref:Peptidase S9 prolyl oligopeptidase catalytic domain-containing protein n=1 Tax=viral metagenome TaxID=1070528 RepID=A0A6C0DK49_9ZZZZ
MASDAYEEIRNLGYIAWKNNLSWMEKQLGSKWDKLIDDENRRFKDALNKLSIPRFKTSSSDYQLNGWKISSEAFSPEQQWSRGFFKCECWDADFNETIFVAAVQDSHGFERFSVEVYKISNNTVTHLKTIKDTGPSVAILHSSVWFLGSDADLRYNSVKSWDPNDVDTIKTHFVSDNLTENLDLKRGEDGSVYAVKSDFVNKQYSLLPSINTWSAQPHLQSGIVPDNLRLPGITENETIESLSFKAGWIVTRSRGIRTLYRIEKDKIKPIIWIWGDVSYDSRDPYSIDISDIRYSSYTIHIPKWILTNPKPHQYPCSYHEHPLPAFVVHPKDILNVKGILITAYGAYGTPTQVGSLISRWKPMLEKGWIVCSVMVPGSGDHSTKWIRAGQRLNRVESINAFKESIEALKEEYNMDASRTVLYGRSAGGLLVSSVAIKNPGLVGALYLESPYVDVLRTITNPILPLTTLETKEFGSIESPVNVLATGSWSPMEHIPVRGIPELFVIARTDTADLEVLPYEPLKFIKRVRGLGKGNEKLIFIHQGRGHFTTNWKSRAEDIALLDHWIEQSPGRVSKKNSAVRTKNHSIKYNNMAMTRRNRNRASRKNRDRKNRASRKNRNNMPPMMGGRKHRKGSRSRKH